ncbi:MAG: DUF2179 domain-containing protein [Sphaerochaetaceae bacterium]|jgi:uncharacterized protein YebE (UPF0316 family)
MGFLDNLGPWIYFLIFFGKIIEVTVATLRMVLINRGERVKGMIIAFFDILLWLIVTGTVLDGYQEDPLRIVAFATAFAVGNYLGSWFEDKLAFGLSSIQAIVATSEESKKLAALLRDEDFAVTVTKGEGRNGMRDILLLHMKRKRIKEAIALIEDNSPGAVIVVNDSKVISGGYIVRK